MSYTVPCLPVRLPAENIHPPIRRSVTAGRKFDPALPPEEYAWINRET
jgi:hypothetical protein